MANSPKHKIYYRGTIPSNTLLNLPIREVFTCSEQNWGKCSTRCKTIVKANYSMLDLQRCNDLYCGVRNIGKELS